jgi:hypothetical protein
MHSWLRLADRPFFLHFFFLVNGTLRLICATTSRPNRRHKLQENGERGTERGRGEKNEIRRLNFWGRTTGLVIDNDDFAPLYRCDFV